MWTGAIQINLPFLLSWRLAREDSKKPGICGMRRLKLTNELSCSMLLYIFVEVHAMHVSMYLCGYACMYVRIYLCM